MNDSPRRPCRAADPGEYAAWIAAAEPRGADLAGQALDAAAAPRALVSVLLPVHRVAVGFLAAALDSLAAQTCPAWEACVAFDPAADDPITRLLGERATADPRIRLVPLAGNTGISAATNAALAAAGGEFVALLDHDDTLAPEALHRMQEAIASWPDADLLYSDKDCIDADGRTRRRPLFKPEWSPEMLYSVNYLTHFNLLRRALVTELGGFRPHTDGAQDWDIFLRVAERARRVVRVPGIHYHWRLHPASTSLGGVAAKPYVADAQRVAIQEHLDRSGLAAEALPSDESGFRIRWRVADTLPVHVIVDGIAEAPADLGVLARTVAACLAALPASPHLRPTRRLTVFAHPERREAVVAAIAADGGPVPGIDCAVLESLPGDVAGDTLAAVRGHPLPGGAVVFVSGRVAVAREGWLEALVGWVTGHPEIGFATGLVVSSDGQVVECGLVLDAAGRGTPLFRGIPPWQWGCFGGPMWYRNVSAAGPWALAVKADGWEEVGGIGPCARAEEAFTSLCVRLRGAGFRGVVEPHARITLGPGPLPPLPPSDPSVGDDPHFHPAFARVVPLELARGAPAARMRRPAALRRLPPALAIAGMHRSGTSLAASLVSGAGIALGERLLPAGRGNERGHFEDLDFLDLHQKALRAGGFHGDGILATGTPVVPPALAERAGALVAARRAGGRAWGWKDPRTLLFLDFWAESVPEATWLLVFRSPWGVADSLFRRLDEPCASDPLLALRAWTHANRILLDFARRRPERVVVRELGQLVGDPAEAFAALRERGVPLGAPPSCHDPSLLGGDPEALREQATIVRELVPEAFDLYLRLRETAGSSVEIPAPFAPAPAAAAAAVSAWARQSRSRTLSAAHQARALAAARDDAERSLREAVAAAEAAARVRLEEAERRIAAASEEATRQIAMARAEVTRVTVAAAATTRRVLDEEAGWLARIEQARHENASLLAEIHRQSRLLDDATGVTTAFTRPKPRTIDKLRREAARLARQARTAAGIGVPPGGSDR